MSDAEQMLWDVVIIDGEPVTLQAETEDDLAQLRTLVDEQEDYVREFVQRIKVESGIDGGAVKLWLDPSQLAELAAIPQDLL